MVPVIPVVVGVAGAVVTQKLVSGTKVEQWVDDQVQRVATFLGAAPEPEPPPAPASTRKPPPEPPPAPASTREPAPEPTPRPLTDRELALGVFPPGPPRKWTDGDVLPAGTITWYEHRDGDKILREGISYETQARLRAHLRSSELEGLAAYFKEARPGTRPEQLRAVERIRIVENKTQEKGGLNKRGGGGGRTPDRFRK